MSRLRLLLGAAFLLGASACLESPQSFVDYDAVAVPDGNGTAAIGAWTVKLTRADVALGPFYFCASASGSSTLCESAVAEVRDVTTVDGLAFAPAGIGRVHGLTGPIQSASYDLGISWFDTQTEPTPSDVAPSGHSMRIEGVATSATASFTFTADVDVVPQYQGQNAVATAPAEADVTSGAYRLEVHFDAAAWTRQLDFDAIAAELAQTGETNYVIEPGTVEHGALLVGIKNLAPIQFRWVSL